ncbi:hypothetical protein E2C01_062612 [Portunus trituberculatus]|uniref:Uncharacterized protein n=1 Tax=Portunus trituberculatus TaxID=210409 RepID=A0A5B7HBL2_PORTR|nr:hypothetical protein [Portunus trituberculatus]
MHKTLATRDWFSPPTRQIVRSVSLARREEMRMPLDLATGRPPEEELPQTAHEVVVMLQQWMEATWRQVVNNCRLTGQTMTRQYQLRAGDAQYAVWDRGWRYKPRRKRGITLKRLENYWECGKAVHRSATTHSCHLQADAVTSKQRRIVHVGRLWAVVVKKGCLWGQQRPPSSPDNEMRSDSVVGDGGMKTMLWSVW